jgi:hypothetical protein
MKLNVPCPSKPCSPRLPEDFVHFEGAEDGFDQHGARMVPRKFRLLRQEENVIPQAASGASIFGR